MAAIDALNGTMFKGRQLAVELSKAQPLVNQMGSGGNSTGAEEPKAQFLCPAFTFTSVYSCMSYLLLLAGGLLPRPPLSIEHQSQAAVLAAAAAAAAGLPIQVSLLMSRACTVQVVFYICVSITALFCRETRSVFKSIIPFFRFNRVFITHSSTPLPLTPPTLPLKELQALRVQMG